jgi:hypothetical protein
VIYLEKNQAIYQLNKLKLNNYNIRPSCFLRLLLIRMDSSLFNSLVIISTPIIYRTSKLGYDIKLFKVIKLIVIRLSIKPKIYVLEKLLILD